MIDQKTATEKRLVVIVEPNELVRRLLRDLFASELNACVVDLPGLEGFEEVTLEFTPDLFVLEVAEGDGEMCKAIYRMADRSRHTHGVPILALTQRGHVAAIEGVLPSFHCEIAEKPLRIGDLAAKASRLLKTRTPAD